MQERRHKRGMKTDKVKQQGWKEVKASVKMTFTGIKINRKLESRRREGVTVVEKVDKKVKRETHFL